MAGSECGSAKHRLPPDGPLPAHPQVCDPGSISASAGQRSRTTAERSTSRCVTAAPTSSTPAATSRRRSSAMPLHVHQVAVVREPELHQEQQLRAARVDDRVVAELLSSPAASSSEAGRCSSNGGSVLTPRKPTLARLGDHLEVASTPSPMRTSAPRSLRPASERGDGHDRVQRVARPGPCARCGRLVRELAVPAGEHHAVALADVLERAARAMPSGTRIAVTQPAA